MMQWGGGGGGGEGEGGGGGFPLPAVRRIPRDASSIFRRDAEAFRRAPGSTGGTPACIDLSVLYRECHP